MDKKAKQREYNRRYRERNRETILINGRKFTHTEKGKKHRRIIQWKRHGIIADNWEEVYSWYLETETCDICDCILTTGTRNTSSTKCLDHDHSITDSYNIRGVICHSCNCSEGSTHRHVYPRRSGYMFQKTTNGKRFAKYFNTLEEAIAFRDAFDIKDYSLG